MLKERREEIQAGMEGKGEGGRKGREGEGEREGKMKEERKMVKTRGEKKMQRH